MGPQVQAVGMVDGYSIGDYVIVSFATEGTIIQFKKQPWGNVAVIQTPDAMMPHQIPTANIRRRI